MHCKHCKQEIRLGPQKHRCTEGDAAAKEKADDRLDAAACSPLLAADDAPRDGTMILAHLGWPWMVPASWNPETEEWAIATWNASAMAGSGEIIPDHGITETWWESDTDYDGSLKGWMPWPAIPENAPAMARAESHHQYRIEMTNPKQPTGSRRHPRFVLPLHGPWVAVDGNYDSLDIHDANGGFVCTPHGETVGDVIDRARLIAAAPAMLATLQHIAAGYGHKSAPGCNCDDCKHIRPVEEAIREALG